MSTSTGSAGVKRRDFLKVLGATGAAGATVGCGTGDVERLIPYLVSPDQTVPGVSNYYATTCRECAASCGIIAEVRDGRPIKLEGNPQHPLNQGSLCARGQSALQGLYNPDRYRGPMLRQDGALVPTTWDNALQVLSAQLTAARSQGTAANAVFINQAESGSFPAFLDQWLARQGIPAHVAYDADAAHASMEANRQTFGVAWPRIDFTATRLVVSVGADFLDGWGPVVPMQLSWANARAQLANAPRMIYIGARRSLTGLNADEWVPARPGSELAVLSALRGQGNIEQAAQVAGVPAEQLQRIAQEIAAGPAVVLSGTTGPDATEVALAAAQMSQGAVGSAILPGEALTGFDRTAGYAEIRNVAQRMAQGGVSLLFVRGANPAFTTPPALGFRQAMARVPFKVSFSPYPDETSQECDLILPDHHALESWGDAQVQAGLLGLQQPLMDPVFNTRQTADVLIALARADQQMAGDYAQPTYREWLLARLGGTPQATSEALARGLMSGTALAVPAPARPAPVTVTTPVAQADGDFFLMVYPSPLLGTGAGANKPWLQELADPVTKLAWQSWVELHPNTAERLGIANGDHVTVSTGEGRSVTAPAYRYLGIQPETVAIALGRGHWAYGRYAQGIGVNPLELLGSMEDPVSGALALSGMRASVARAGGRSDLVTTEGSARQHGRGIARALLASQLASPPPFLEHHEVPGLPPHEHQPGLRAPVAADAQGQYADPQSHRRGMYDPNHWSGMAQRRWAMTIDLARCTGCSACVVACYAENNIPTVGAPWQGRATAPGVWDERPGANIVKGREMTWLRLERYFEGGVDGGPDFEARFVPMLCQHCGNAPCEPVCPVYATYHAPDGLNVQVYNRCVGTRYCSNNCPYKVRYFNWFGYGEPARRQYAFPEPLNWQLNPDVTVRGKGVMEKCTFCVQRIREAENRAVAEGRSVQPDEFTTACAQGCPSRAITFGDAADQSWSVAQLAVDTRAYHVFEELNTYTAVVYLQKVNHPAPAPAQG